MAGREVGGAPVNIFKKRTPELETADQLIAAMSSPPVDKQVFFLLYSKLVAKSFERFSLTYEEPGILNVEDEDGSKYILYLENLWIMCQNNWEAAADTIRSYLKLASALGKTEHPTRDGVIAWIKDQTYVDLYCSGSEFAVRHLAADLWIIFAYTIEAGSTALTKKQLSDLRVTDEEVLGLAVANLKRNLSLEVNRFREWFLLSANGDFVASALLFDDLWTDAAKEIDGDLVAAVPVSDSIFYCGSRSEAALAHIRKRALALEAEGDHVISSTMLRRVGNHWEAFD
jgi:uncharacterized protein YtpQ (UPF0354 family)